MGIRFSDVPDGLVDHVVTFDGLIKKHRRHLHAAEVHQPDEGRLAPCLAPAEARRRVANGRLAMSAILAKRMAEASMAEVPDERIAEEQAAEEHAAEEPPADGPCSASAVAPTTS